MGAIFDYALIRAVPDPRRGEWVNIGAVVFHDAHLDIRLLANLSKLRVLAPQLDMSLIAQLYDGWQSMCAPISSTRDRHALLTQFPLVHASPLARFVADSRHYEETLQSILRDLVEPPPAPRAAHRPTRLVTRLRQEFERAKLLATNDDGINQHRVVANYAIDASAGLYADFALRNGKLRITETIDFRVRPDTARSIKHNQAGLKCATLARAMRKFGDDCVPSVVYIANEQTLDQIQPSLNMLGGFAERVYDADNRDDFAAYLDMMQSAALTAA